MTFELSPHQPEAPRTDPRRSRKKSKTLTVAVPVALLRPLAVGVLACAVGWGIGMRSGYTYAKRDAAAIMSLEGDATYAKPKWREWADKPVEYDPPANIGMLMSMVGGTIPGTGGMTTGDIWNGTQDRLKREFFRDPRAS